MKTRRASWSARRKRMVLLTSKNGSTNISVRKKAKPLDRLAEDEQLPTELLNRFLSEYDFSQKVQPEIIQTAVKEKHLGLLKTRRTVNRILDRLRNIIRTFSWD